MNRPFHQPLLWILLPLLMVACAEVRRPPGGPEDKTPPTIVAVSPENGATNVDTAIVVKVTFSEDIKTATLRQAFGVSPPPPGSVRSEWDGSDNVSIRFEPGLLDDRTYVITLGTQLSDDRGNTLENTQVIAFSTGDSLDTGRLTGRLVLPGDANGWTLAGYYLGPTRDVTAERLDSTGTGDPDPSSEAPYATSQTAIDGSWRLTHLKQGWWRVFAFLDQDADRLWTPWLEQLAVPPFDVYADADSLKPSRILFLRPQEPRVIPQVGRAMARQKDFFLVRFDRKPPNLDVQFSLTNPPPRTEEEIREEGEEDTPREWKVVPASFDIPTRTVSYLPGDSNSVAIRWDSPVIGELIGLRVHGSFGYPDTLDTTLAIDLAQVALEDTFPPTLVKVDPEEKSRLHTGRNRLQWLFSEPVTLHADSGFWWRNGADTLRPEISEPGANRLAVTLPDTTPAGPQRFELLGRFLRDASGNTLRDSSLTWVYSWLPGDSLGTITGEVQSPNEGVIHLTFIEVFAAQLPLSMTLNGPGEFSLENVPAGRWQARGWQDVSGTNAWRPGQPLPYVPSDPVMVSLDTVDVRARWETGDVEIIFP